MKRRFIWIVICTTITLGAITLSSCGTTKITPVHKCELMQKGQKCLTDHSCCE